ncbi:FAD-binding oxidoreductase [Nocardioides sp. YIM 152315]|uniref:FAD-binding oxidoreductase n=1 Tax=Nocardioides sp. YIM 152315 TaxID=3031760 RepID=UPI0023DB9D99|nr:FAD-binding oxidoreductase [Nocardioides sp. YIM 152315]MDF1605131.1 FAD-binding oxidoreductase [Nocardioides sp. YIM 152315]
MTLIDRLHEALGPGAVLTEPDDVASYVADWTGRFRGSPTAVVRPADTGQVAAVVGLCADAGVAVVPQGGNTGLAAGATPRGGEVVLSLERMRRVRDVDPVADTITVEAGAVLQTVQEAARQAGRLFPLSLGSEGSCTIGGNVATNAGGTAVLRYGMMRDLVLGLEVVLPDGRVWHGLRALRKDNTGYDLKQLFIGSEGTLGIVTAAVLRLVPATPRRATALLALPDVECAVGLLPVLREHGGGLLTAWELLNRQAVDLVVDHLPGVRDPFDGIHGWYGLVELAGTSDDVDERLDAALAAAVGPDLAVDAVVAGGPAQRASLWALREGVSEAQRIEGVSVKHDVTVPIAELPRFVARTGPRLEELLPGVRLVTYGHVGDGNLHYNLSAPAGNDDALRAAAPDLTAAVYDEVAALGGSISAEHGLGALKRQAAAAYKSDVENDLMRAVKQALDPRGAMNPGKVLP